MQNTPSAAPRRIPQGAYHGMIFKLTALFVLRSLNNQRGSNTYSFQSCRLVHVLKNCHLQQNTISKQSFCFAPSVPCLHLQFPSLDLLLMS